jgi:DNA-binding PadR family transcriptional regulator
MSAARDLTPLELTALGNIWKKSGCTAYEVMTEFASSTAAHYRASAGSIYPLVARLERGGYLQSRRATRGRQRRQVYAITAKGRAALRQWLSPPLPDEEFMVTPDMLRTRVYFLRALSPAKRREFLDHAHERLHQELRSNLDVLRRYRNEGNVYGALAVEGAVTVMRARSRWIARLRRELAQDT